jgi:hypothetical protein
MNHSAAIRLIGLSASALALSACGKGTEIDIVAFKPPVQEAAGTALATSSLRAPAESSFLIDATSIRSRFFSSGPTDILNILGGLDGRLAEIEERAADSKRACLDSAPVALDVAVFGGTFSMKVQCYDEFGDGSGFMIFGRDGSTWYVFERVGAVITAGKATDLGGGKAEVEVYGGVGISNGANWDSMSYAGYHIKANNSSSTLEMTAAGVGVGYCGVHLKSDGTNLFVYGSPEGAGTACSAIDSACVLTSSLSGSGSCAAIDQTTFGMTGLGRIAVTGATGQSWLSSTYPASGANLTINGTSSDSIHFGPTTASEVSGTSKF